MIERINTGSFLTNTYIISNNEECIIVDPGLDFKAYAEEIKRKYRVQAILLTHGHIDHIDGIGLFEVPIYIHKLEREFLSDPTLSLYNAFGSKLSFDVKRLQVVEIEDGMVLELIGYQFTVIHTPGHTRGSVCYLWKDKLLSGDTLFLESVGRTDFPTGDSKALRRSLERLALLKEHTIVYPGHEGKTTIQNEKRRNPFMR